MEIIHHTHFSHVNVENITILIFPIFGKLVIFIEHYGEHH
jgi:hypothetical protein